MEKAEYWIEKLKLQAHPEGGFFRETYRSAQIINKESLPDAYKGSRASATSIYFLLRSGEVSVFHRIASDEMWYFHAGNPVQIHFITTRGELKSEILGNAISEKQQVQVLIPGGTIFGAEVVGQSGFSLMGCMVTPGFDFQDFEMLSREKLLSTFPQHKNIILRLTK